MGTLAPLVSLSAGPWPILPDMLTGRHTARAWCARLARHGVVPAVRWYGALVGLARPPGVRLVLLHRRGVAQHRVYHAPRGLHGVLAREEDRVAPHGVAEQALVRSH